MKDYFYFFKNKERYDKAIPKLRELIKDEVSVVCEGPSLDKLISLSIQLGRLKGIVTILNLSRKHIKMVTRTCLILGVIIGFLLGLVF